MKLLTTLLTIGACFYSLSSYGTEFFHKIEKTAEQDSYANLNITMSDAKKVYVDLASLSQLLLNSSESSFRVALPMPDGTFEVFLLSHSPVYAPALVEKYPNFRTFEGVQVNNPSNRGRFDITPQGFHGMFWYEGKRAFIDPDWQNTANTHFSYFKANASMHLDGGEFLQRSPIFTEERLSVSKVLRSINGIKTFRLAIAAAGEYTAFHGGTKALALSAIVTAVNRINEIYMMDLGVKFELVADNDKVIFDDAATDPFKNTDEDIDANEALMNNTIGTANYDVGHVFNTGGGGLAFLGVVCNDSAKWGGMTGSSAPTADPFVIDYVAHELGHQFGAEHTFNGTADSCANRVTDSAFEPGSGSTIMAYAGICADENLQRNSDAFFHSHSLSQINAYLAKSGSCAKVDNAPNQAPTVNAGKDYAIPANTPFKLVGSATDPESDVLSFSWEQVDLGTPSSSPATMVDDGTRPIFRAWLPIAEPVRYFPRLSDVLANKLTLGESYPTTNRNLNFKLVARDGKGNTSSDSTKLTSVVTSQAFSVVAPKVGDVWAANDSPTVNWNVAGTTNPPISCANVDILLAQDGQDFAQVLLASTPNDGSEPLSVPSVQTASARLMIRCSDNIFYAVNNGTFTISGKANNVAPIITGQNTLVVAEDNSITIKLSDLIVQDPDSDYPNGFSIKVLNGNNYSVSGTQITPMSDFNGSLEVPVVVNDGKFDSASFVLNVTVTAVNDAPQISASSTITTLEDTPVELSLAQFTVSDVDSSSSNMELLVLAGQNYQVNGVTVTPGANFNGELLVNVRVSDGLAESKTFQALVNVSAVNDAPVVTGQVAISVLEDSDFDIKQSSLNITDPDSPSSAFVINVLAGDNYSVTNGSITPKANFNGNLTVQIRVSDGELESALFAVLVQVNAVNDAPVANSDAVTITEGSSAIVIDVLSNDTDVDGDNLSIGSVNYTGSGTVAQVQGGISYTPAAGFSGSEIITYQVLDGNGGEATATVSITVTAKSQPIDEGGDSGGSLHWFLAVLLLVVSRRVKG